MVLTKAIMADYLFQELGLNKREARDFLELFFVGKKIVAITSAY